MVKLNTNSALSFSKEFTIIALENSMIKVDTDPKVTAERVATFYKELVKSLIEEDN